MAHYDLYNSLGLDRSADPATLGAELNQRINSGVATNPGGMEELRIAREILGDPQRRSLYDQKLDDPNAPEINIAALRELAQANFGGAPAAGAAGVAGAVGGQGNAAQAQSAPWQGQPGRPGQPQGEQAPGAFDKGRDTFNEYSKKAQERLNPAMEKTRSEIARSSKGVILGTALITALVMLLLWGLISAVGGDRNAGKAEKLANQFLELRTDEETERWLIDNAVGDARSGLNDALDINDGFSGVDNFFRASDPKAGEIMDFKRFARLYSQMDDDSYERALRDAANSEDLYLVEVRNGDGSSSGGSISVAIQDGKARIVLIERNDTDVSDIFNKY
ncbi:hypothetical protein M3A74_04600 [Corynebacterium appendicis]|uniref:hypothetical protein n=1 Tax=Corynebacterium appendicis TaxID=163202 RepID=UPI00223AD236|nr:hypothetical protein [Corynebacterium appendicis]MCT1684096.1 hypothetical protein [Corynebacterium appendicis]